ncbi:MAG: serine protease, partial [Spirochaetales bacterium]|nr:serine protease [Spirochaetales bacterium]
MKNILLKIIPIFAVVLFACGCATSHELSSIDGINYVTKCCYEVVLLKCDEENSNVEYEKELPMDLLDINYRNDDYISIGTAFAISKDKLLTASHVLNLYSDSKIYKKRFIREKRIDKNGKKTENIYEIDKIYSTNNSKDYVLFSVKDKVFDKWLDINTNYEFNSKIYTAGNALGEGIVIRDGILLDKKAESENGEWDYLKSSIMTNPGNSGGPLLNEKGEALGIVISKKDDFCYSLPISEVKDSEALFHVNLNFGFSTFSDFLRKDFNYDLKEEGIELPIKYSEYAKLHKEKSDKYYKKGMDELFEKYNDETFPNGESSIYALNGSYGKSFPTILLKDNDVGLWYFSKRKPSSESMENNGRIRYSQLYKNSSIWL